MTTTAVTRVTHASSGPGFIEICILLFFCTVFLIGVIFLACKICKARGEVILVGFAAGFAIDAAVSIYLWASDVSWTVPFHRLEQLLPATGLPSIVFTAISVLFYPLIGTIIALLEITISKSISKSEIKLREIESEIRENDSEISRLKAILSDTDICASDTKKRKRFMTEQNKTRQAKLPTEGDERK